MKFDRALSLALEDVAFEFLCLFSTSSRSSSLCLLCLDRLRFHPYNKATKNKRAEQNTEIKMIAHFGISGACATVKEIGMLGVDGEVSEVIVSNVVETELVCGVLAESTPELSLSVV